MQRRFAEFIESPLDDAIPAGTAFQETFGRAAITVFAVAIITFFGRREKTVTADGSTENKPGTNAGIAEIRGIQIGIVTLLRCNGDSITADVTFRKRGNFKSARIGTAVTGTKIPVITPLSGSENSIAAESYGSH